MKNSNKKLSKGFVVSAIAILGCALSVGPRALAQQTGGSFGGARWGSGASPSSPGRSGGSGYSASRPSAPAVDTAQAERDRAAREAARAAAEAARRVAEAAERRRLEEEARRRAADALANAVAARDSAARLQIQACAAAQAISPLLSSANSVEQNTANNGNINHLNEALGQAGRYVQGAATQAALAQTAAEAAAAQARVARQAEEVNGNASSDAQLAGRSAQSAADCARQAAHDSASIHSVATRLAEAVQARLLQLNTLSASRGSYGSAGEVCSRIPSDNGAQINRCQNSASRLSRMDLLMACDRYRTATELNACLEASVSAPLPSQVVPFCGAISADATACFSQLHAVGGFLDDVRLSACAQVAPGLGIESATQCLRATQGQFESGELELCSRFVRDVTRAARCMTIASRFEFGQPIIRSCLQSPNALAGAQCLLNALKQQYITQVHGS